jgi:hypothetical protein
VAKGIVYINRRDRGTNQGVETVDEFSREKYSNKEIVEALYDYRVSDSFGYYYTSQRCTKAWRES